MGSHIFVMWGSVGLFFSFLDHKTGGVGWQAISWSLVFWVTVFVFSLSIAVVLFYRRFKVWSVILIYDIFFSDFCVAASVSPLGWCVLWFDFYLYVDTYFQISLYHCVLNYILTYAWKYIYMYIYVCVSYCILGEADIQKLFCAGWLVFPEIFLLEDGKKIRGKRDFSVILINFLCYCVCEQICIFVECW